MNEGLTINTIDVALQLLQRVNIKGSEVEAYVAVINALNKEKEVLNSPLFVAGEEMDD